MYWIVIILVVVLIITTTTIIIISQAILLVFIYCLFLESILAINEEMTNEENIDLSPTYLMMN